MQEIYNIGQAAKLLKRTVRTLQLWDSKNILKAERTVTNRRFYTKTQLMNFMNQKDSKNIKKIIAYCRVSSHNQIKDLKNQRKILEDFCLLKGYVNVEFIEEIGGGMNFKRKKFQSLVKDIQNNQIEKVIIAHKDRLTRFGYDFFEWNFSLFDCKIEILNNEQLSPEKEMVQDLMTIIHCFSSRLYGLRNYKKDLNKLLKNENNS